MIVLVFICLLQEEPIELESFGEHGARVPYFLGSLPDQAFFSDPPLKAIASGMDFSGFLRLADVRNGELLLNALTLENPGHTLSTVMISAEFSPKEFKNFLIRLYPHESLVVQTDTLASASDLYFISINNFKVNVHLKNENKEFYFDIKIRYPMEDLRNKIYNEALGVCINKTILMRVENWVGESEDAWFHRFKSGLTNCNHGPNSSAFELDIYWPNSQTLHHAGNGTHPHCNTEFCDPNITCIPKCQMFGYSTTNVTNTGNILFWRNINYTAPIPNRDRSFDGVLFEQECGKAFCREQQPGGTLCLDDSGNVNQDIFWYVYHPQAQPCP